MMTLKFGDINKFLGTEGSGHQNKIWIQKEGTKYLVKIDSKYREASKECSVSKILETICIDHVKYTEIDALIGGKKIKGCICASYLKNNEESIALYNIIENLRPARNISAKEYFSMVVEEVNRKTNLGIEGLAKYIILINTIDFIVMNPDRHLNNIEFIRDGETGKYRFAPLYDLGQSFLKRDSMISKDDFERESYKFKAMPFSTNPSSNLIDLREAKQIAYRIKDKLGDIDKLAIPDFHKLVVRRRVDKLLNTK